MDSGQPVAVMILMTLQYVPDADDPHQIVRTLMEAVPPGSYLAISDVARDLATTRTWRRPPTGSTSGWAGAPDHPRPGGDRRYFDGLELPPAWGSTQVAPDLGHTGPVEGITLSAYCGVGRKP